MIPDHVPAELVYDCVLAERRVYEENVFETKVSPEHGAKPPIYWCPNIYPGDAGAWMLQRFEDLKEVYADDELFTKRGFSGFAAMIGEDWNQVPTELGGELHTKVRRVLNPEFTPAKMFALDGAVRGRARELIARFKDRGACDFVSEFAVPFPVSIFLDLFGLPQEQAGQFL
jgi:cytochrome P450